MAYDYSIFSPYLRELQKKLVILLLIFLISGVFGFIYYQQILLIVMRFFNLEGITIALSSPYQFIDLAINTGAGVGALITFFPLVYFVLDFLRPALTKSEYKIITRLIPATILLFILGFGFGTWVMQTVINLYTQTATTFSITNIWDISKFFSQTLIMGICLGLLFETPIVVTLLIKLRVLSKQTIQANRRYVYISILILAALLPPGDIISLAILTFVPLSLFELSLLFNKSVI